MISIDGADVQSCGCRRQACSVAAPLIIERGENVAEAGPGDSLGSSETKRGLGQNVQPAFYGVNTGTHGVWRNLYRPLERALRPVSPTDGLAADIGKVALR